MGKKYIIASTAAMSSVTKEFDSYEEALYAFTKELVSTNPEWAGKVFIAEVIRSQDFPTPIDGVMA